MRYYSLYNTSKNTIHKSKPKKNTNAKKKETKTKNTNSNQVKNNTKQQNNNTKKKETNENKKVETQTKNTDNKQVKNNTKQQNDNTKKKETNENKKVEIKKENENNKEENKENENNNTWLILMDKEDQEEIKKAITTQQQLIKQETLSKPFELCINPFYIQTDDGVSFELQKGDKEQNEKSYCVAKAKNLKITKTQGNTSTITNLDTETVRYPILYFYMKNDVMQDKENKKHKIRIKKLNIKLIEDLSNKHLSEEHKKICEDLIQNGTIIENKKIIQDEHNDLLDLRIDSQIRENKKKQSSPSVLIFINDKDYIDEKKQSNIFLSYKEQQTNFFQDIQKTFLGYNKTLLQEYIGKSENDIEKEKEELKQQIQQIENGIKNLQGNNLSEEYKISYLKKKTTHEDKFDILNEILNIKKLQKYDKTSKEIVKHKITYLTDQELFDKKFIYLNLNKNKNYDYLNIKINSRKEEPFVQQTDINRGSFEIKQNLTFIITDYGSYDSVFSSKDNEKEHISNQTGLSINDVYDKLIDIDRIHTAQNIINNVNNCMLNYQQRILNHQATDVEKKVYQDEKINLIETAKKTVKDIFNMLVEEYRILNPNDPSKKKITCDNIQEMIDNILIGRYKRIQFCNSRTNIDLNYKKGINLIKELCKILLFINEFQEQDKKINKEQINEEQNKENNQTNYFEKERYQEIPSDELDTLNKVQLEAIADYDTINATDNFYPEFRIEETDGLYNKRIYRRKQQVMNEQNQHEIYNATLFDVFKEQLKYSKKYDTNKHETELVFMEPLQQDIVENKRPEVNLSYQEPTQIGKIGRF